MELNEAIEHCQEIINSSECDECKKQHMQLKTWLEELKILKERKIIMKQILEKDLSKQICPHCGCKDIGIDNWGMFEPEEDWFYFCKECDGTFYREKDKTEK